MKSARQGEVDIHVNAPPEAVWRVVADLDRMGEWSPECYRVEWLDGAHSPATPGRASRAGIASDGCDGRCRAR